MMIRKPTYVENINDVIFSTDENGILTYVSPRVTPAMGYDPSEIMGKCFEDDYVTS